MTLDKEVLRTLYNIGRTGPTVISRTGGPFPFYKQYLDNGWVAVFTVARTDTIGIGLTPIGAVAFCDALGTKTLEEAIAKYEHPDFHDKYHY